MNNIAKFIMLILCIVMASYANAIGQNAVTETTKKYIAAYNKLTQLVSEGKGDTLQAQAAFSAYKVEKEKYEKFLKENEPKNNRPEENNKKAKTDDKSGNTTHLMQEVSRSDGSHLRKLAIESYSYDLDSDNRMEEILLIPSGENQQGQFFSLIVLNDTGGLIWSGPKELNSDNPLVFGKWHYGISMPEILGDIDGDDVIELISPVPQSDVSPTIFRVLSWTKGAFKPARISTLLETPPGSDKFSWTSGAQSLGVWVSSFKSITSLGEITVEITDYQDGADATIRQAVLQRSISGFDLKRWIKGKSDNGQSSYSTRYRALLSSKDHMNSRGNALTDIISILRQDRANYHLKRHRDSEDESDPIFSEAARRKDMDRMSLSSADNNWRQRILDGTPLVEVTVGAGQLSLKILNDSVKNKKTKNTGRETKIINLSPIFLVDEMYQYYKTPAQVVYIYVADSLFTQSNVSNVGSPKINEKQVSISFVLDGRKERLHFIESNRKVDYAEVMVGSPKSSEKDSYRLRKINGRWAIVGVPH